MQRTVYSTKITYAKNEINENGNLVASLDEITVHETDEKKALKMAVKKVGMFQPLKVEKVSALYVLDDDIFFKYAKKMTTDEETTENVDEETTENAD